MSQSLTHWVWQRNLKRSARLGAQTKMGWFSTFFAALYLGKTVLSCLVLSRHVLFCLVYGVNRIRDKTVSKIYVAEFRNCIVQSRILFTPPTWQNKKVLSCPCRQCELGLKKWKIITTEEHLITFCESYASNLFVRTHCRKRLLFVFSFSRHLL